MRTRYRMYRLCDHSVVKAAWYAQRRRAAAQGAAIIGLVGVCALATTCCASPTAPSYTCTTQPRLYSKADGSEAHFEVDTYMQDTPCPAVPIN